MKLIKIIKAVAILVNIFLFMPFISFAQGGPGGDPDVLPVDGGISILAAAGITYGIKKLRDFRKGSQADPADSTDAPEKKDVVI